MLQIYFQYYRYQILLIKVHKFPSNTETLAIYFVENSSEDESEETVQTPKISNKTTRAKSLTELQARLEAIKKSKKKMSYKDKLLQKGVKNRMRKKSRQDEKNAKQKLIRAAKLEETDVNPESSESKPTFNSDNKIVFSKIDFSNVGKKKNKKTEKDPKKILKNLERENEKMNKLEAEGNKDKAIELKEKQAWKNALSKAQGEKVKDDPILLKKSVKKLEQMKKSSQKKWEKRIENVNKQKEERQKKRTENIQKRKKEKKLNKLKKAAKRGKVIPGF